MEEKKFRFDLSELDITVSRIENIIGFNEGDDREYVRDLIGDVIEKCHSFANIKAQFRIFNDISFNKPDYTISIENVSFDTKKIVYNQLRKSESLAIFLCTAGEEIGARSRKAMEEKDLLTGFIYDVAGSEIVEAAADKMQQELERFLVSSGRKITNRYSPGYCSWDVAEQHKIFSFFPENYCDITLTASALMKPEKSVSGFIGIGGNVKMNNYTCGICEMKNCLYSRVKKTK